eukprot:768294-Hanusia_phi.AAC.2
MMIEAWGGLRGEEGRRRLTGGEQGGGTEAERGERRGGIEGVEGKRGRREKRRRERMAEVTF